MIDVDTFGAIREVFKARKEELTRKKMLSESNDDFGNVQQRLAGNATSQQACSAKPRFGLNNCDIQPFVGCQKRCGITAGTTTKDNNWSMHERGLPCKLEIGKCMNWEVSNFRHHPIDHRP